MASRFESRRIADPPPPRPGSWPRTSSWAASGSCTGARPATRRTATLPGDELIPTPNIVATRAVEIDAPPSAVWPWLVQMGPGRGGAYTYDWIERRLGVEIQNTDRIHPRAPAPGGRRRDPDARLRHARRDRRARADARVPLERRPLGLVVRARPCRRGAPG